MTLESAKQLKAADEASDDSVRKFAAHSMVDGIGFSTAAECKERILKLDGTEGAKSIVKSEKREKTRKVRQYHYCGSGIQRKNNQEHHHLISQMKEMDS